MPKNEESKRILALRPGSRELGVAVFEQEDLIAWKVANFRQPHLPLLLVGMRKRLHSLIEFYEPDLMAMESISLKRRRISPYLDAITGIIHVVALEANLELRCFGQKEIRQVLCGSTRSTGRDLVTCIIASYPKVRPYADWTSRWQESYWMPMFTAIAVGLVCLRKTL